MTSFDRKIVQLFQKIHFHRDELKFFLSSIPRFDVKIDATKTNVDDNSSNPKWDVLRSVLLKKKIQHQYQLTLRHIAKNAMESSQKGKSSSISCWIYETSNAEGI